MQLKAPLSQSKSPINSSQIVQNNKPKSIHQQHQTCSWHAALDKRPSPIDWTAWEELESFVITACTNWITVRELAKAVTDHQPSSPFRKRKVLLKALRAKPLLFHLNHNGNRVCIEPSPPAPTQIQQQASSQLPHKQLEPSHSKHQALISGSENQIKQLQKATIQQLQRQLESEESLAQSLTTSVQGGRGGLLGQEKSAAETTSRSAAEITRRSAAWLYEPESRAAKEASAAQKLSEQVARTATVEAAMTAQAAEVPLTGYMALRTHLDVVGLTEFFVNLVADQDSNSTEDDSDSEFGEHAIEAEAVSELEQEMAELTSAMHSEREARVIAQAESAKAEYSTHRAMLRALDAETAAAKAEAASEACLAETKKVEIDMQTLWDRLVCAEATNQKQAARQASTEAELDQMKEENNDLETSIRDFASFLDLHVCETGAHNLEQHLHDTFPLPYSSDSMYVEPRLSGLRVCILFTILIMVFIMSTD